MGGGSRYISIYYQRSIGHPDLKDKIFFVHILGVLGFGFLKGGNHFLSSSWSIYISLMVGQNQKCYWIQTCPVHGISIYLGQWMDI